MEWISKAAVTFTLNWNFISYHSSSQLKYTHIQCILSAGQMPGTYKNSTDFSVKMFTLSLFHSFWSVIFLSGLWSIFISGKMISEYTEWMECKISLTPSTDKHANWMPTSQMQYCRFRSENIYGLFQKVSVSVIFPLHWNHFVWKRVLAIILICGVVVGFGFIA